MSVTILAPRPWTAADHTRAAEYRPNLHGRLPGSHLDDLGALQKLIQLCPTCRPKFSARRAGYERWRATYNIGPCDGCQQISTYCEAFIHSATHDSVGEWQRAPRRGRWATFTSGAHAKWQGFTGWGSR